MYTPFLMGNEINLKMEITLTLRIPSYFLYDGIVSISLTLLTWFFLFRKKGIIL